MEIVIWSRLLHLLAALWLSGGVFAAAVVRAQSKRAGSLQASVLGLRLAWRLTAIYTIPGLLVVGLAGLHLVGSRGLRLADPWLAISITLWLVMLVVTLLYLAPRQRRAARAGEAALSAGAAGQEFHALAEAKLPGIVSDLNALLVVVITLLMVYKP